MQIPVKVNLHQLMHLGQTGHKFFCVTQDALGMGRLRIFGSANHHEVHDTEYIPLYQLLGFLPVPFKYGAWEERLFECFYIHADGSKLGEWAIIELQGDLRNRSNDTLHSQLIGDLHYTEKGAPVLIVGHHILYGKEQALEKPFIVAERVRHKSEDSTRTEYLVRAVVKRKLLFKSRPKPIIATVNKSV